MGLQNRSSHQYLQSISGYAENTHSLIWKNWVYAETFVPKAEIKSKNWYLIAYQQW